jgi:arylsulfatase
MHIYTHLTPQWKGKTGLGVYADGMVEHDSQVGQLLAELKKLGIADNTIVVYTTDNGAELLLWPDGGMIPFHGEKNTTWDGGFRVPMLVKWPGHIKPGGTPDVIQSANGSLRARRRVRGLSSLACGQCVGIHACTGDRGAVPSEFQGIPAAREAGQLQPRSGPAEDAAAIKQLRNGGLEKWGAQT